jgi:aminopeptidase N
MSTNTLARDEAVERARLVRDVAYRLLLDLMPSGDTFVAETWIRFACTQPGASTFLDLVAPGVREIEVNGRAVPAEAFDGNRVRLDNLAERNEVRVLADCAYMRTGSGLHRFVDPVDGRPYLHTQFEPFDAHRVLACFDQPDIKAPLELRVHAPADWAVVSNMSGTAANGRWEFAATPRLSTYLYAVVAGPYHVWRTSIGTFRSACIAGSRSPSTSTWTSSWT